TAKEHEERQTQSQAAHFSQRGRELVEQQPSRDDKNQWPETGSHGETDSTSRQRRGQGGADSADTDFRSLGSRLSPPRAAAECACRFLRARKIGFRADNACGRRDEQIARRGTEARNEELSKRYQPHNTQSQKPEAEQFS